MQSLMPSSNPKLRERNMCDKMLIAKLRIIRRRRLLSFAGVPIAFACIGAFAFLFEHSALITIFPILGTCWFIGSGFTWLIHSLSICPSCNNFFFLRGLYGNVFSWKCLNCGLPLNYLAVSKHSDCGQDDKAA